MSFNQDERLHYEKKFNYGPKTLIGTWFEDHCKYVHQKHNHVSNYSVDYIDKGDSQVHPNIIWNNKIRAEGYGPRILMDHEKHKYHHNYCTTYDLTFNHFPKMWKETNNFPADYAENFGNITNYGLQQYKKEQWKNGRIDPPPQLMSEMRTSYIPHEKSDYSYIRLAPPRKLSSNLYSINRDLANFKSRNNSCLTAPDPCVTDPSLYQPCPLRIRENPCKTKVIKQKKLSY